MVSPISSQAIAPTTLLRGQGAWGEALPYITQLCQRPLLLGRSMATQPLRDQLSTDLEALGLSVTASNLRFDCCEVDLHRLADEAAPVMQSWLLVVERFSMQENFLPIV
jgi:glycerol dehydrogenase